MEEKLGLFKYDHFSIYWERRFCSAICDDDFMFFFIVFVPLFSVVVTNIVLYLVTLFLSLIISRHFQIVIF